MNDNIEGKSMTADGIAFDRRIPLAIVLALLLQGAMAVWWAATKDSDDRFHEQRIDGVEQMVTLEKEQQAEVAERLARIEERVTAEASALDRIEKQLGVREALMDGPPSGNASAPNATSLFARRINPAGVELIKNYEGLHFTPYLCSARVWTIGYGHTRTVRAGMLITPDQADQFLDDDLRLVERAVQRIVKVPLNDNQYAALVSFAFNVGIANFERSTLVTLLNRGWYEQVPAQLMRWNRVDGEVMGGLSRRRAAEGRLWNTPTDSGGEGDA